VWCCLCDPTFSRFSRTPTCDGRTDIRTQGHVITVGYIRTANSWISGQFRMRTAFFSSRDQDLKWWQGKVSSSSSKLEPFSHFDISPESLRPPQALLAFNIVCGGLCSFYFRTQPGKRTPQWNVGSNRKTSTSTCRRSPKLESIDWSKFVLGSVRQK